ncbi:MAG: CvpA family protein [Mycoplasmatota bacterium]
MNIIDVLIILFILFGASVGFKNGITKQLVSFVGLILVVVLSFVLKNYVSVFLYENLPFFNFGGFLNGVSAVNIIVYEIFAFLIVFSLLTVVFRLLLKLTSIFEAFLRFTIILGIPSKILGAVVGAIEYFVYVFIILYVLSLPIFSFDGLEDSKFKNEILTSTPILSEAMGDMVNVFDEFNELKKTYENDTSSEQFNYDLLELLLKYGIISTDSVEKLVSLDKIEVNDVYTLIEQYKEV